MSERRLDRLPKWAQQHIENLNGQIREANRKYETIVRMHAILCSDKNRQWFTINNEIKGSEPMKLWLLNKDHPFPVCSIDTHDVLFIGRASKGKNNETTTQDQNLP